MRPCDPTSSERGFRAYLLRAATSRYRLFATCLRNPDGRPEIDRYHTFTQRIPGQSDSVPTPDLSNHRLGNRGSSPRRDLKNGFLGGTWRPRRVFLYEHSRVEHASRYRSSKQVASGDLFTVSNSTSLNERKRFERKGSTGILPVKKQAGSLYDYFMRVLHLTK
jgi:hypothetical protein